MCCASLLETVTEQSAKAALLVQIQQNQIGLEGKLSDRGLEERKVAVTDGLYAETKGQLGGIQVLEARDMNHAIQLISQCPGVKLQYGTIEIRPAADIAEIMRESEQRRRKDTSR